jgi:hypothetical protein
MEGHDELLDRHHAIYQHQATKAYDQSGDGNTLVRSVSTNQRGLAKGSRTSRRLEVALAEKLRSLSRHHETHLSLHDSIRVLRSICGTPHQSREIPGHSIIKFPICDP